MGFLFTDLNSFIFDLLGVAVLTAVLYFVVSPIFLKDKENDE